MIFEPTIEKEDLENMEMQAYEGEIQLVFEPEDVKLAVEKLSQYTVLGFDTETRPAFQKGKKYQTALLQLAGDDIVFLFQLKKMSDFSPLQTLLNHPKILKAGAAIRDDVKGLNHYFPVKKIGFVELQEMAQERGIEDISLKKMAAITLGFRISKNKQVSNWEADPLDEAQVRYAATDAWVSLRIYQELKKA